MEKKILSINTCKVLKAILCLFVLMHHTINVKHELLNSVFSILGPLAVGGFFFLSGYGLIVNYKKYGKDYIKKLLFKRIPLSYLIVVIANTIYLPIYALTVSTNISFLNAITSILYISFSKHFIAFYSWIYFMTDLIIYYLLFALIFIVIEYSKKIKNKIHIGAVVHFLILLSIYLIISLIIRQPLSLRAAFCLSIGVIIGAFEEIMCDFILRFKLLIAGLITIIFVTLFLLYDIYIIEEQILPILFCLLLIVICTKVNINFKPLTYLGNISLYVYLSHGIFVKLFKHFFVLSPFVLFLLVAVCSILLSSLIYILVNLVKRHIKAKN